MAGAGKSVGRLWRPGRAAGRFAFGKLRRRATPAHGEWPLCLRLLACTRLPVLGLYWLLRARHRPWANRPRGVRPGFSGFARLRSSSLCEDRRAALQILFAGAILALAGLGRCGVPRMKHTKPCDLVHFTLGRGCARLWAWAGSGNGAASICVTPRTVAAKSQKSRTRSPMASRSTAGCFRGLPVKVVTSQNAGVSRPWRRALVLRIKPSPPCGSASGFSGGLVSPLWASIPDTFAHG